MGNSSSSTRDSHGRTYHSSSRHASSQTSPGTSSPHPATVDRNVYTTRNRSFLHLGSSRDRDAEREPPPEPRRETKQEREARKLEKERIAREKERERSVREEGVDGGFLVTLGTYTGPEDFNKAVVRQLMVRKHPRPISVVTRLLLFSRPSTYSNGSIQIKASSTNDACAD